MAGTDEYEVVIHMHNGEVAVLFFETLDDAVNCYWYHRQRDIPCTIRRPANLQQD